MDAATQKRLSKVHSDLAARVARTIGALAATGLDVRVVQGLRTYEEQNVLYQQGRSRKGPKVTNAKGGQSNHNFGLAVDLCPFDDEGSPDWDNDRAFSLIGAAGKTQGLEWGGDWSSFPDRPHLQLKTGLKTSECRDLYATGGLHAVWAEANRRLGIPKKAAAAEPVELEIPAIHRERPADETHRPGTPSPANPGVTIPGEAATQQPTEKAADEAQPSPVTTTVEKKTVERSETTAGESQTTTTETQAATVEVKKERPSIFVQIGVTIAWLTGIGFNVGSFIQTKIEAMTPQQIAWMIAMIGLPLAGIFWWQRSARAAQNRTMQLVEKASDPNATTVKLVDK